MHGKAVKAHKRLRGLRSQVHSRYCPEVWLRSRSREGASLGMLGEWMWAKPPDPGALSILQAAAIYL